MDCFRRSLLFLPLLFLAAGSLTGQSILLDDFETDAGWRTLPSDGATLRLSTVPGKTGNALALEFNFAGGSGYTIAQKDFSLTLPSNYQFTFDMRADAPVNNFEFKLLDSADNVWWIKKMNITYPAVWTGQKIKKRHLSFAWGPAGGGEMKFVKKIEFVVSVGTGGKGTVFIDNFRFEPIDDASSSSAVAEFHSSDDPEHALLDPRGLTLSHWFAGGEMEWCSLQFNTLREIGGLVIDWDSTRYATSYDILLSNDGKEWRTAYHAVNANGGRDYIYLPESDARWLKISCLKSHARGYHISRMEVKGPDFSTTPTQFYMSLAADAPRGSYPRYLLRQQTYWTVVGTSGDTKEALINELGTVEVDQLRFSIEPFLFINNALVTWNDVTRTQSLEDDYLPIPSVTWNRGGLTLTVTAFSAGTAGSSQLILTYKIENRGGSPPKGKLFLALRPFQVNPPWQFLHNPGGVAPIDSIRAERGFLRIQDKLVIPLTTPDRVGATSFDAGDISEFLRAGALPAAQAVTDPNGFASAAIEYDYDVPSGSSVEYYLSVPFHAYTGSPQPGMGKSAEIYASLARQATATAWRTLLDKVTISLPPSAQAVINTVKSNLAYIFINRDGVAIQPGSRSYERSWIRDGSLTSTALLQFGIRDEVRDYLNWYTRFQYPSGKIPCVVDDHGADPVPEHDSHGEFIYAVLQYFRYTGDTAWLRTKLDPVVKTVRYIQSLRAERKTDMYRNGTPEQRACYGLVPQSISHEGYSSKPMHSYWDDFFTLRGLEDASTIAGILGERALAKEFAAERDDFRVDLYASMRLAMETKKIDYIPGCVELGDFDATSTTIGINPVNELGAIPEPQLHNTFERYYDFFTKRKTNATAWVNYTPYENRVIGAFVALDQKERAQEALRFFMHDRRPAGWNQWAEVVWHDSSTPQFIGDMPHTWCGSDFMRSVRSMFVYERDRDTSLVVCAGLADAWVDDSAGISVRNLPTYYGPIGYTVTKKGNAVLVSLQGSMHIPRGGIVVKSPLSGRVRDAVVGKKKFRAPADNEVILRRLPATVEFHY